MHNPYWLVVSLRSPWWVYYISTNKPYHLKSFVQGNVEKKSKTCMERLNVLKPDSEAQNWTEATKCFRYLLLRNPWRSLWSMAKHLTARTVGALDLSGFYKKQTFFFFYSSVSTSKRLNHLIIASLLLAKNPSKRYKNEFTLSQTAPKQPYQQN